MIKSKIIIGLIGIIKFKIVIAEIFLLSYAINKSYIVRKYKSTKAVFVENLASNFLASQIMFLSKNNITTYINFLLCKIINLILMTFFIANKESGLNFQFKFKL